MKREGCPESEDHLHLGEHAGRIHARPHAQHRYPHIANLGDSDRACVLLATGGSRGRGSESAKGTLCARAPDASTPPT